MKNLLFFFVPSLFALIFFYSCKKKRNPAPSAPASHTTDMGGSRIWHGSVDGSSYGTAFGYTTTDTFSLTILNDSEIEILNNARLGIDSCKLKLSVTDTVAKTLLFNAASFHGSGFPIPYMVIYYYAADSIFLGGNGTGISGWEGVQLHTP